jgi:hypothetical protein
LAQGGDYLWYAKDNQLTLHEDVQRFFETPDKRAGWHREKLPETSVETIEKGHGRVERHSLTAIPDTTLQEDSIRMSHSGQAEAEAVLHNFINGLFSKLGFSNHVSAIRRFNAAIDRTLLLNFL